MSKTITLENPITAVGRFFAKRKINKLTKQVDKKNAKIQELEEKYFSENSSNSTTKKVSQKTKVVSNVYRYFLQDDSKKGVCSAQIKRICGNKAIWERATNGKKNLYVARIENMPSDKVDEVMQQFKNLDTYFVKSPYKAKIWSKA